MMKSSFLFVLIVLFTVTGCRTKKIAMETPTPSDSERTTGTDFSKQETWLLGYFDLSRLSQPPYSEWYSKGYDDYQPNPGAIASLSAIDKSDLSIKIVMGTWCPDSRREVPRFMKVLVMCEFPLGEVTFIGVDNEKQSPIGEYGSLGIERVPTFIVYKNKVEAGRIIENPVTSLEQDLLDILKRNEKQ